MKFSVDPWDVEYGASLGIDQPDVSTAQVSVDLELAAGEWRPIDPSTAAAPRRVLFIDGVRRIDARVWIESDAGDVHPGMCASFAAGSVRCDERAEITSAVVDRGVFSAAPNAADIVTSNATYPARMAAGSDGDALMLAVHERMAQTE